MSAQKLGLEIPRGTTASPQSLPIFADQGNLIWRWQMTQPNYLYRNRGDGTFEDVSFESGYAVNGDGREMASMGIGVGDYLNNGRLDLLNSNFSDDYKVLYRNDGDLNFTDVSYSAGIATATIPFLSWGNGFLDFDNDGWKDLFIASGHIYPPADTQEWGTSWRERPLLFRNLGRGNFELVPAVVKTGLSVVIAARALPSATCLMTARLMSC